MTKGPRKHSSSLAGASLVAETLKLTKAAARLAEAGVCFASKTWLDALARERLARSAARRTTSVKRGQWTRTRSAHCAT